MSDPAPQKKKHFFAAIPPRAAGDRRLGETHFRVLVAVALHDQMSLSKGKGQGCWSDSKSMSERWKINYTQFARALSDLVAWGYVQQKQQADDKRRKVFRVVYLFEDNLLIGKLPRPPRAQRSIGPTECDDPKPANEGRSRANELIYSENGRSQLNQEDARTRNPYEEIGLNPLRNSVETAPLRGADYQDLARDNPGGFLAKVQREMGHSSKGCDADLVYLIETIAADYYAEPLGHQAQHMLDTYFDEAA
jgi:hypothetical protein